VAKVIKGPIKFIEYGLFSVRESEQEQHEEAARVLHKELSIIGEPNVENLNPPVNITAVVQKELNRAQKQANQIIIDAQKRANEIERRTKNESEKLLSNAKSEVDKRLQEANKQAQDIKKQTRQKAEESGKEEGFRKGKEEGLKIGKEEGYKKGYQDGISKGKDEYRDAIESIKKLANEVLSQRESVLQETESDLIELVISIAEKVINEKISKNEVVYNNVKKALEYAINSESILVRINPEDLATLGKYREEFLTIVGESTSFEIIEDENIDKGGCVLDTNLGQIDARISSQMEVIKGSLKPDRED